MESSALVLLYDGNRVNWTLRVCRQRLNVLEAEFALFRLAQYLQHGLENFPCCKECRAISVYEKVQYGCDIGVYVNMSCCILR